jgi:hypothetical protein
VPLGALCVKEFLLVLAVWNSKALTQRAPRGTEKNERKEENCEFTSH